MKSGLELIFKQNKTKPDQEKVMWQEFNKFFKIKEDVELGEAASKYTIYHKTFTSAATHAKDYAEKQGYDLDDGDWNREVTMGGASGRGRPGEGKTKRFNIGLEKNGKPQKKRLQFQVFGMPKGSYELNMYIEGVELEEAEIATSIGSGGTAGLDMGLTYKKKKEDVKKAKALRKQMMGEDVQRTIFAGKEVFIVDSETFYNCRLGKKKYSRYEKYVGTGKVGQTIREYGLKYPRRPIILQNGESGPMLFLKYGRS